MTTPRLGETTYSIVRNRRNRRKRPHGRVHGWPDENPPESIYLFYPRAPDSAKMKPRVAPTNPQSLVQNGPQEPENEPVEVSHLPTPKNKFMFLRRPE